MCLSPVAGAAAISARQLSAPAGPVLLALAAGVLGQAARISLDAAFRTPAGAAWPPARPVLSWRPLPSPPWPSASRAERAG